MGEVANSVEAPWLLMDVAQEARHSALKLRFKKPSGWQFLETNEPFVLFEITEASSAIKEKRDELPTITLLARGSFGKPLNEFLELVSDGIKITHPRAEVISQQARELLRYPSQQRTFTISGPSEDEKVLLTLMTAVEGEIGYLLFYSAKESEFFEKMGAFEEVAGTLRFEQQEAGLDPYIRHQILTQEYTQTGDWERAIQELEQMQVLWPQDKSIQQNLSYLYSVVGNAAFIRQGDLPKAEIMLKHSLELNENQPRVRKTLELVRSAKKDTTSLPTKEDR